VAGTFLDISTDTTKMRVWVLAMSELSSTTGDQWEAEQTFLSFFRKQVYTSQL
jgi:hypothetical protein